MLRERQKKNSDIVSVIYDEVPMRWITAHDLHEWSKRSSARAVFPGLIADLITASATDISSFRFPNREKGQVRGFDGVLTAKGVSPFIPEGESIWEFGLSADIAAKANEDFKKRTNRVPDNVRAKTTFVFATAFTWDSTKTPLANWLEEKRALGQWKDVELYDGAALEHWLDAHPAVASYYAKYELGLAPTSGVLSSDEFWDEFSLRFAPVLTEDVLLAGREEQAVDLLRRLSEGGSRLAFAADFTDEVIAFVVAVIRRASPEVRDFFEARVLVIDDANAARQLTSKKGLIFLPRGQARKCVGLLAQAGPTVISAGADEYRHQHDVLNRPSKAEMAKAFVSMGIDEAEGYEWARRCGRSLAVLARQKPSGTAEPPEWLKSSEALIPALIAGAWKPSVSADSDVLKMLGDKATYEEVEAPLRGLIKLKDSPIDRVDDLWAMRSTVDAFVYLGHLIGKEHLARFSEQAKVVFSQVIEPRKSEEVFSSSRLQGNEHSQWLREGLMTTMLHMVALHQEAGFIVPGSSPQRFVDDIVRNLPGLSSDYRLIESLRDQLPLLAEAAPIPFFDALECLLEGDIKNIKPIFCESNEFFAPVSAHTGVLWALELLAWDEAYLLRAAMCLAKLAAIDPGGKLVNRPINSLRDILLSWSPQTNANCEQRIGVLRYLSREMPSIAWPLLMKLLPKSNSSTSPTQKPKFAEASPGGQERLTYGVVWAMQEVVIELSVEHAKSATERWQVLIDVLEQLQPNSFDYVLNSLERCLDILSVDQVFKIWDALRKKLNRHILYTHTSSTLSNESLDQLKALVIKHTPEDPVLLATWLFDEWMPDVARSRDEKSPMIAIEAARLQALKDIVNSRGVLGLSMLAEKVLLPQQMIKSLSELGLSLDETVSLVKQLLGLTGEAKSLASVVVARGFASFGSSWMSHIELVRDELSLADDEMARLLAGMDDEKLTWDMVSALGVAVDAAYWQQKSAFRISGTPEEIEYAINRYCSCGRSLAAIEAAYLRLDVISSVTILTLLQSAISEINAIVGGHAMVHHYVEHMFDELEKRADVKRDELAQMEFAYLPFFRSRRKPLNLHKILVESPEFFVSTISAVYKPENGDAQVLTDQQQKMSIAAYELLNGLTILPGQVDDKIDFATLKSWVDLVRQLATQADRSVIADSRIGSLFAHSPSDPDDEAWPHRTVRLLVEELSSARLEDAVKVERFNMRGVFTKALGEGGQQERVLADQAKSWAHNMPEFPRTANMLLNISKMWIKEAESEDISAQQEALRR